jgi:rhamnulokinase
MTAAGWDESRNLPENFRLLPLPGKKCARTRGGMGLWPFQQCVKLWKERGDFPGYKILDEAAEKFLTEESIDPDTPELFSPENMEEAIFALLGRKVSPPEITALLLRGAARKIALTIKSFDQDFTGCTAVGGGVGGAFFCRLLAKELKCPLRAGNTEATAAGNIAIQKQVIG